MKRARDLMILMHPKFDFYLFDDEDCRNFIKDNFDDSVLQAYDSLIPGAYKADLWRYCILYINGGIYMDMKYHSINNFRFIELTENEFWVLDIDNKSVYNALMIVKSRNEILMKCIDKIVENVRNKFYGNTCLEPTGPALLGSFISNELKTNSVLKHMYNPFNETKFILYKNIAILKMYKNYYLEQEKYKKIDHYFKLWCERKIYK
jgi:hypothetical protein